MKKAFLLITIIVGMLCSVSAQVCRISNSNDNVEVTSYYFKDNNTIVVAVSNDSQDISANVTVNIKVHASYKSSSTYKDFDLSGKKLAKPNGETLIEIKLPSDYVQGPSSTIEVKGITGTKCQN